MMRVGSWTGTATSSSKVSRRVGLYDEEPLLSLELELGDLDGVLPRVSDGTVTDPGLAGRVRNLHIVKGALTTASVKDFLTCAVWLPVRMRPDLAAIRAAIRNCRNPRVLSGDRHVTRSPCHPQRRGMTVAPPHSSGSTSRSVWVSTHSCPKGSTKATWRSPYS